MGDMEPLRVISEDGREWGKVPDEALIVVDQETKDIRLQYEELDTVSPDSVGYESWEDNCLRKFSEFLGISTTRYENEIMVLVQKMVSQQLRDQKKGNLTETKCARELRKLECTINYNGQSQNRGGGKDRGGLMLKLK